jgi:hypothetical protein
VTRPSVVAVALAVTAVTLLAPAPGGRAVAGASPTDPLIGPTVILSVGAAKVGSAVIVQLTGWPAGVATVSICGDAARRGSVDCDQIGSRGVGIPATGSGTVRLVVRPPIGCPCVVRVSTPSSDLVRTVPLDVPGVAVLSEAELGPELLPSVGVATIVVTARLERNDTWSGSVLAALGGPVDRRLVLSVRNVGPAPVAGVSVSGAIGRSRAGGAPLTVPPLGTLAPGEERTVPVAVPLPALAAGHYVVFGRVDSMAGAASFETPTDAHPWGLLVVATLMIAIVVGNRARRPVRERRSGTTVSDHDTSIPEGVQLGDGGGRAPGRGEQHEQRLVGVGAPDGDGVRRTER